MRTLLVHVSVVLLLTFCPAPAGQNRLPAASPPDQDGAAAIFDAVEKGLKAGDDRLFSAYFSRTVSLNVRGSSTGYCSANQAGQVIRHFLSAQYAEMIARFKEAFQMALPHLTKQELTWRLHFVMGALSYTLAGTDSRKLMLQVITNEEDNDELLLQRLAPFLAAGLKAPLGDAKKLELVSGD